MAIKSDKWIKDMAKNQGMIEPFQENQIKSNFEKIDVLINNAGVGITGPLEETPNSEIEKHFKNVQ